MSPGDCSPESGEGHTAMNQGLLKPRPTHIGQHVITGHLRLQRGLGEDDHSPVALPSILALGIKEQDHPADCRLDFIHTNVGCDCGREWGQSLRGRGLGDLNLLPTPDRPQATEGVGKLSRWRLLLHKAQANGAWACWRGPPQDNL